MLLLLVDSDQEGGLNENFLLLDSNREAKNDIMMTPWAQCLSSLNGWEFDKCGIVGYSWVYNTKMSYLGENEIYSLVANAENKTGMMGYMQKRQMSLRTS